jgi:hypothetical protein
MEKGKYHSNTILINIVSKIVPILCFSVGILSLTFTGLIALFGQLVAQTTLTWNICKHIIIID